MAAATKNYIVLLKNKYLLFFTAKPTKKGNYLSAVRLFEMPETVSSKEICAWSSKYESKKITEVLDWE